MNFSRLFRRGFQSLRRRTLNLLLPQPAPGYAEHSMIFPVQGGSCSATDHLIDLALSIAREAREIELSELTNRVDASQIDFTPIWPGEHYRLLAALVKLLQPRQIVEVGTLHGLSALALMKFMPSEGRISTFDVVPWTAFSETCLRPEDFADGRLKQELGDLAQPPIFDRHRGLIEGTDLLFVDGPKDGIFERKFLENLQTVAFRNPLLILLDDIRVWNMLAVWQSIDRPKLDMTSFGHWSGTGLVEWKRR